MAERAYDSQIAGLSNPLGITGGAADTVWISQPATGVSEYDAYPSQTLLGTRSEENHLGLSLLNLAINNSTGQLYISGSGNVVGVFENGLGPFEELWETENGFGSDYVAVDNSAGATQGRVYVAVVGSSAEIDQRVRALKGKDEPDDFSGHAPYISNNHITGTPSGSLGELSDVATDAAGNFYLVDKSNKAVDEFAPSGIFVQAFTGAEVPGGFSSGLAGVAVDPTDGDVLVVDRGSQVIDEFDPSGHYLTQLTGTGAEEEVHFTGLTGGIAVNSNGYVYLVEDSDSTVDIFTPNTVLPKIIAEPVTNSTPKAFTVNATIDPNHGGAIESCRVEYGTTSSYGNVAPCSPAAPYGDATQVSAALSGLTAETTYHYRLVVANADVARKGPDQSFTPHAVDHIATDPPTNVAPTSVTLNGSWNGTNEDTHYYFQWGPTTSYGNNTSVPPGVDGGSTIGSTAVSFNLTGLASTSTYHYRIVAQNSNGISIGADQRVTTLPLPPLVSESVSDVHSDTAVLHAEINPGGGDTKYHFEYGTSKCSEVPDPCTVVPVPDGDVGSGAAYANVSMPLSGLTPSTTYYFRVVAQNVTDTTDGPDRAFNTFLYNPILNDRCPNAHVRQQTGADLLLDCRAYELVSAANAGGYNVESDLVPGATPYPGYPEAQGRVLYAVHAGGIPATNHPTNRGPDPYVATRGTDGWSTEYVGVPATNPFSQGPFSSVPSGTSADLGTLAFGGAEGCSPCFAGGYTGIPVRLSNGELVQGMVASPNVTAPGPDATSDGYIAKPLSADGRHLIFGSTSQFAPGGNDATGDISIYDHNLTTGETHVVSNLPGGEDFPEPLPCLQGAGRCSTPEGDSNGIAELAVSSDGSHILLGQKVSEDADHNVYWRLYMDVDDSISSVDLTPGATHGVLFDGMSADGSSVYFTTKDQQLPFGGASAANLYEAEVSQAGSTLSLIAAGAGSCSPVANFNGSHWNSVGAEANCDPVAIGGGGGVAATADSIYFLSPDLLDAGHGVPDQPNLYLAAADAAPRFIATLSPVDPMVLDAVKGAGTRHAADFQTSSSGDFSAFTTAVSLSGYDNAGHLEIYRYDAADEGIQCVSCDPTNAEAAGDATLAANGLSLTNDGRVFFNSTDALVPRDLDGKEDVYEWEPLGVGNCGSESPTYSKASGACLALISTGASPFASSLLGASSNGTDVYFFTNDTLAAQDSNGPITKIYDARAGGGFPYTPPQPLCAASDECHGAGSSIPGSPEIRTLESGPGNFPAEQAETCRPGFLRRYGKCAKKPSHHHKHHRQAKHRSRGGKK